MRSKYQTQTVGKFVSLVRTFNAKVIEGRKNAPPNTPIPNKLAVLGLSSRQLQRALGQFHGETRINRNLK